MEKILEVSQVNAYIKSVLDRDIILSNICVRGEISNCNVHYTGHIYLTLKDSGGVLKGVMFKGDASKLAFTPKNDEKVIVYGRISVYEATGQYQIYITSMEQDGVGDLAKQFELLKEKLQKEGLFEEKYKKPLPKFPQKIGVITSNTGAAVQDIKNILARRFPCANVYIFPVLVQGSGASTEIAGAIKVFNEKFLVDVIICGRGGGSIEDLWAFNEEIVARAIFNSQIPIVSAVGHETDFTIADFVADLRAPTPSAAAELVVPDRSEWLERIENAKLRLCALLKNNIETKKLMLQAKGFSKIATSLRNNIQERKIKIDDLYVSMQKTIRQKLIMDSEILKRKMAQLDALSPLKVLARGYGVVAGFDGKVVKKRTDVNVGDKLSITLTDGKIKCICEEN